MPVNDAVAPTRVLDAVHRVLHCDLFAADGDRAAIDHLLTVADVLLHRAVLDDLAPRRRRQVGDELAGLVDRCAGAGADRDRDPFSRAESVANRIAAGRVPAELASLVLRCLAAADLPELGRAASPDREAAETAAMDWLGREAPAAISAQDVSDYLAARAPLGPGAVARSVTQLSGGFSKTTILVSVQRQGGPVEEIVLRQVPPGRDAHTLVGEYDTVSFAWEHGVNAPEPLWIEPEDNPLGGPFFASRRVAGSNLGDVFGPRPGTGPEAGLGLATALAQLHQVNLDGVPATPVVPMVSRKEIIAAIDQQSELARAAAAVDGDIPHPLHALLFEWLREHAPDDVAHPVLLHGDPGFHNMLVHDGEVTALLDWERARLGDAAQDLAYVRPHVTRVQPWQDFLDAYCAAGGTAPDEERLRYYSVWHDAWRFTGAYRGRGRLLTQPGGLLAGVMGLLHAPRFLLSGLQIAYEVEL